MSDFDNSLITMAFIGAVIGSAIVPTLIAQRWFAPPMHALSPDEIARIEARLEKE